MNIRPPNIPLWLKWGGSLAAFAGALRLNHLLGVYVDRVGARSPSLPEDILLDFLPHWDLRVVFVWGFAAFLAFAIGGGLLFERRRAPYILWLYAVLILVRDFFLMLTPMGQPSGALPVEGYTLFDAVGGYLTFKHDLFFSAHTSMPFLGFLVYERRELRAGMLLFSFVLAAGVLVCRYHYSVDIAAAYFITYAVVKAHQGLVEPRWSRWTLARREAI
ncbi:MAG: phosphatase PAP2-related protein [Elusimicrobiota bacterium]